MNGSKHLDFDEANRTGNRLITSAKDPNFGLLIVVGIHLGLRISDLIGLTYGQLSENEFTIVEKKTGKERTLSVNPAIRTALSYHISSINRNPNAKLFISQKGTTYSTQHVNRLMKKYFKGPNVSSHSLRKTFGRRVWESNGETEKALVYLSDIFNHTSLSVTRRYLGIRDEEIKNIYLNL